MRTWNLTASDPLSLTLAADARLGATDYADDHIWELVFGKGSPPAVSLQTTYGLRARSMRLFPSFTYQDYTLIDPSTFHSQPVIQLLFPNFVVLKYSPFQGIDVFSEYWVPESHVISGRVRILNQTDNPARLKFEWIAQLTPADGQRMAFMELQAVNILAGSTGSLEPLLFMTGGPKPGGGIYPSLELDFEIPSAGERQVTWVHSALADTNDSFALARSTAGRNWEAERSRLEILNSQQVEILTGDPDWDAVFMLTQKKALEGFVGPTEALPYPSIVTTRSPDQGHSLRGDGSDYNHLWNGQTALDALYLSSIILPAAPQLARGLLLNFLSVQEEGGSVDWKPGLAGQRGKLNATPVLCCLAWKIYESTDDREFLEQVFPRLLTFARSWFSSRHDRDQDGFPEWDHPSQGGMDDHPAYSPWNPWSQGADISAAENPGMGAFLYREYQSLAQIARVLGCEGELGEIQVLAERLRLAVEDCWNAVESAYLDRDRESHFCTTGAWLGNQTGPGLITLQNSFSHPVRLLFHIQSNAGSRPSPHIFIHGKGASGTDRIEHLAEGKIRWLLDLGRMTGELLYSSIDHIEVQGLGANDYLNVYSVGFHQLYYTSLLPLWAGIPAPERAQELVEGSLLNPFKFWRTHGIPACAVPPSEAATVCDCASPAWNALLGEGLLAYGYRREAADLCTRLVNTIIENLKREAAFRRLYRVESGLGQGERDALTGLAPLGFFLDTLGIRLVSSHKVAVAGFNPFPWPVTVKYRGMTVLKQREKTTVVFPDGQTVNIDDPAPRIVALEKEAAG